MSNGMTRVLAQIVQDLRNVTSKITGAWRNTSKNVTSTLAHGTDEKVKDDGQTGHEMAARSGSPTTRAESDPSPSTADQQPRHDPYQARRESLFFDEDPERRAAARAEWLDELRDLVDRDQYQQADLEFRRVLRLPEYKFHGFPRAGRPPEQFVADGLVSRVSGEFGGRDDVFPPDPSSLRYLIWAEKALDLGPDDVLLDVGSGIGKAVDFFGMFTDAKKVYGMEIEPDFASFSNQHAADLGLNHVRTLNADVLEEPLPDDVTAVYLFNPFGSTDEKDAVGIFADKLVEMGESRPLKVAVVGPNMVRHLEGSDVFSLQDEKDFIFPFQNRTGTSSWKFFTSG